MQFLLPLAFLCTLGTVHSVPVPQDAQTNSTDISPESISTTPDGKIGGGKGGSNPVNGLLAAAGMVPGIGESINALSGTITQFEVVLAQSLNVQTTENAGGACRAMTVIFARGTTEPGNVGVFTGPAFFDAIQAKIGAASMDVQGVEYSASVEGFLQGGDAAGSQAMASLISSTLTKCPNTKIVMSGYSQGGQLVHKAAASLPAATMARVSCVVIFGDPNFGQAVSGAAASKTLVICHPDDNICQHGDLVSVSHLTYSKEAGQAATFAASAAGLALGN